MIKEMEQWDQLKKSLVRLVVAFVRYLWVTRLQGWLKELLPILFRGIAKGTT